MEGQWGLREAVMLGICNNKNEIEGWEGGTGDRERRWLGKKECWRKVWDSGKLIEFETIRTLWTSDLKYYTSG